MLVLEDWEKEMLALTIVYRMVECREKIPMLTMGTRWAHMDTVLSDMYNRDLIKPSDDNQTWRLDSKGQELLKKTCGMVDAGLGFEIFGSYNLSTAIDDSWWDPDGKQLHKHMWDPRFDPAINEDQEDLRLAMMTWMGENLKREGKASKSLDVRKVVYLRHLANGNYGDGTDSFLDPSRIRERFQEVEAIANAAYRWEDLADDKDTAFKLAGAIYTAGMLQLRKEEGTSCGDCGAPLVLFPNAKRSCPICKASFEPPPKEPSDYQCPKCSSEVQQHQSRCSGCGVRLDFRLPEGEEVTSTITETHVDYDVVYGSYPRGTYYGYVSCGWYDPWDPTLNALAFGILLGSVLD
jgi:hypothetical protein